MLLKTSVPLAYTYLCICGTARYSSYNTLPPPVAKVTLRNLFLRSSAWPMCLGRACISPRGFCAPPGVGGHTTSQIRSAEPVPLPEHRRTTVSPRSLAMLCVGVAVVASAEGAESSPSASSSVSTLPCSSGGAPYWRALVLVCG